MALFTFKLPDIGEGISEAEIVAWHVKVGDAVSEDQPLADMMTDKATVEMESPVSGTVVEIAGEAGDVIAIGGMLVVIETAGEVGGEAAEQFDAENPDAGTVARVEEAAEVDAEDIPEPFVPSEVEAPAPVTEPKGVSMQPVPSDAAGGVEGLDTNGNWLV